jgi:chloride intracellular channel protein 5
MSNNEMILAALGFSNGDSRLDEFKTNFGYDWTDDDLDEAIEVAGYNTSNVRNCLMEILWLKVVYYFVDTMGCSREVFDCYINGSLDTHFYYNGTEVKSEEELLELVNAA